MDIVNNILLSLHLLALAAGGGAAVGGQVIGRLMPSSTPEVRGGYMRLGGILATIGRFAIATLVITGPIMIATKYQGIEGLNWWFWVKMVGVVTLIIGVVISTLAARRLKAGDMSAAAQARQGGMISGISLLVVVIAAAFTFS